MTELARIPGAEEALQKQTADFVAWERRRAADNESFYKKYEELKERHHEVGTDWGRRFDPVEKAGYDVWKSREVGEDIPLMPLVQGENER
jgi:hypothetical protein